MLPRSMRELLPGIWIAECSPEQAARLRSCDHHRARIDGRLGVLITYHWGDMTDSPGLLQVGLVFQPGLGQGLTDAEMRAAVLAHPPVPPEIQVLVNELMFKPV